MQVRKEQCLKLADKMNLDSGEQDISDNSLVHAGTSVNSCVCPKACAQCPPVALPPKPEEPRPEDCCGQGCQPCIFDVYQQQLSAWEAECIRLEAGKYVSGSSDVISPLRWSPFRCISVECEADSVYMYCFESTERGCRLHFYPWQYVIAQSNINSTISRAYTPLPGKTDCQFSVLVKLYEGGLMSEFWKKVRSNQVVLWKGPYEAGLHYIPNSYSHLMMFCAGTGLAPCYALAHHVVSNELDETFVKIIFSCRARNNMLLRGLLRKLRENWNFTSITLLTQDDGVGLKKWYGEEVVFGRITSDIVANELAGKTSVSVVICGTRLFNKDICGYVRKCGVRKEDITIL